jgi:hypothetical protein
MIANSTANIPALNLLTISAIDIPISCNTELPNYRSLTPLASLEVKVAFNNIRQFGLAT